MKNTVLSENMSYSTALTAPQCGFYDIELSYSHGDWDQWISLEVRGENGESLEYMPTLPGKMQKNTVTVYLFKGKNTVTVTHLFGHELKIYNISISDKRPISAPAITPSSDCFFTDKDKKIRILLLSLSGEPIAVKSGDTDISFSVDICRFDDSEDKFCSGDSLIRRYIYIERRELLALGIGKHTVRIILPDDTELEYELNIKESEENAKMTVVSFDVGHGNASLIRLPSGKNLMIDSGYGPRSRHVILPYLEEHGLKLDYYLLTHFHSDHDGIIGELSEKFSLSAPSADDAQRLISAPKEERERYLSGFSYLDSTMLCRYDRLDRIWDLGDAEITVLNSRFNELGEPLDIQNDPDIIYNEYNYENSTSVSLLVRYNGFGYYHGADNYSYAQQKNLEDFKAQGRADELECQYFYANHHFHNDVNSEFLRAVNPVAVYIPANQAVYARSAFSVIYNREIVNAEYPQKRLKDTFISHESGTVTVKVNSGKDWYYYTDGIR